MSTANSRATRLSWVKSLSSALPAPGYWIFTATWRPSRQTARCTWPIDAAAVGLSSNSVNLSRQSGPRSSASTRYTVRDGSGGADSWSRVSVARYGPASSGGSAASKIDSACPNFIAPPLSSPRTRKIWSAVRCWISAATSSAGRPPIRLPRPSAVRPARPTGRVASLAVRVKARRGRSLTSSIVGQPDACVPPATGDTGPGNGRRGSLHPGGTAGVEVRGDREARAGAVVERAGVPDVGGVEQDERPGGRDDLHLVRVRT